MNGEQPSRAAGCAAESHAQGRRSSTGFRCPAAKRPPPSSSDLGLVEAAASRTMVGTTLGSGARLSLREIDCAACVQRGWIRVRFHLFLLELSILVPPKEYRKKLSAGHLLILKRSLA